ncbi:MAG: phenylacetate--CoA ligase, partial [Bacteroidales bacterium]
MIWNKTKESMGRDEMRELQGARLRKLIDRVYHNVPFYREKMQLLGMIPDDIQTIDDIKLLPFTTKQDLRDNYPFGLMAVPQSDIVRIHASSGTTGNPTVVGYTRRDLAVWQEAVARCLTAFGGTRNDIFSVAYGYGLFTGGLGLHYGVEHLGAAVVPMSSGNTDKHIHLIRDLGITGIACTPSYVLHLAETMAKQGITKESIKLRIGVFGGEPWTENMRRSIEEKLNINAYNIYGLSEITGPGVSHECQCKNGSHIIEDHFFPEIIDSVTCANLSEGEQGELVFTTLTKEGMPLIRYRTKDLCSLIYKPCDCGRTSVRMSRIVGRCDDMLIIRGINVFPSQVESVILQFPEFEPQYMLVVTRDNNRDNLEVQVELREEFYSDEINKMVAMRSKLARQLQSVLGISAEVKIVEPNTL